MNSTTASAFEPRKKLSNGQRVVVTAVIFAVVATIAALVITEVVNHHRTMSANESARARLVDIRAEQVATLSDNQITVIRENGYSWEAGAGGKKGFVRVTIKLGNCYNVAGYFSSTVHPATIEEVGPLTLEVPSLAARRYVDRPGSLADVSVAEVLVTAKSLPGLYRELERSAYADGPNL